MFLLLLYYRYATLQECGKCPWVVIWPLIWRVILHLQLLPSRDFRCDSLRQKTDITHICEKQISLIPHGSTNTPLSRLYSWISTFMQDISGSNLCYLDIKVVYLKPLKPRGTTYSNNKIFCILSSMALEVFLAILKLNINQFFFVVETVCQL
jgi:hypothetical protein